MNYMHHLDFETVEQGEINIKDAEKLRDSMGGGLYYSICDDDVQELKFKLLKLKNGATNLTTS